MLASINWENINIAGAFVLGAILATIAVLRVVRAVSSTFTGEIRRSRRKRPPDEDDD